MNFMKRLMVIVALQAVATVALAGDVRVFQRDSFKGAKVEFLPNEVTIEPTIARIKDNVGLRVGFLFWSTELFTGNETRLDKDIYFILAGTPDDFYFNLVNLNCDNGKFSGAQSVVRIYSVGQLKYNAVNDMVDSHDLALRFLFKKSSWLFHKLDGSSHEANGNYLCTDEFKSLMSDYHTSHLDLQKTDPFQLRFEPGKQPKITVSWGQNWEHPGTVATKNLLLRSQELLATNISQPTEGSPAGTQNLYRGIIEAKRELLQSLSNVEYVFKKKLDLAKVLYEHNSGPMTKYANSVEDFIGSMSFISMMAAPLSGNYAAEIIEKSTELTAKFRDEFMIRPEEEKVRKMQLEDLERDLHEKNQKFEKYLNVYLAAQGK